MSPIISVQDVSKVYNIGSRLSGQERYRTLRESLTDTAVATWRKLKRRSRSLTDVFGGSRVPAAHPAPPTSSGRWTTSPSRSVRAKFSGLSAGMAPGSRPC